MIVTLTVDSDVWFDFAKLKRKNLDCWKDLRKKCTHQNPDFFKQQRLGFSTAGIPRTIKTFVIDGTTVRFQRGLLRPVRKILGKHGHEVHVADNRLFLPPVEFQSKIKLRPEQVAPVESIAAKQQGLIRGPCSCLDGDSLIRVNRGGKGYEVPISRLFESFNGLHRRYNYDRTIPTKVRSFDGHTIQLHEIDGVTYSGKRLTFLLTLEDGSQIRATPEHRIMTRRGWKALASLSSKDRVMIDQLLPIKTTLGLDQPCKRQREKMLCNMWHHPYACSERTKDLRGFTKRIHLHRAVYEAHINGVSLKRYISIFRRKPKLASTLKVFDPKKFHVHHRNFDHFDNRVDNLELLTAREHAKVHAQHTRFNFSQGVPHYVRVAGVGGPKFRHTYDIQCKQPHPNFVANGVVVHNSGKTVMLLEAIARAKQPALVIVWSTFHQKQWINEAVNSKLMNISRKDIGGVGGIFKTPKYGKLNICMQQSLWREKNLNFFRDRIGFVGCDEVQKFAANTFQVSVNKFPAKYRVGVSANERRRDGKEFLIYSSFGKVIHSISESANIGSRMRAQVFLVPTDFYSEQYEMRQDWTSLIGELSADEARNNKLVSLVKRSIAKGKLCLVLTERVGHALFLKSQFSRFRVGLLIGQQQAKKIRESDWPKSWKEYVTAYNADSEFTRVTKLAAKRKLDVIIATAKGDVGLNVKTIDHGFITTPTGSNTERFNQQKGRAERHHDGKKIPRIYYLWDVKQDRLREAGNVILKVFPGCGVFRFKT